MFPVTWPEFARLHPFAPLAQTRGYQKLFQQLEEWLAEITGFAGRLAPAQRRLRRANTPACSSSAPGTKAAVKPHRNVCLIPTSAHGTNPASAVMAGLKVVRRGLRRQRQY